MVPADLWKAVVSQLLVLLFFLSAALGAARAAAPARLSLRYIGATPKRMGDPVVFDVVLHPFSSKQTPPVCRWEVSSNGAPPFTSGTLALHGGSARCITEARELGFLTVRVALPDSAAVSLTLPAAWQKIAPLTSAPADLDVFWKKEKERLAAIRSDPLLNEISGPDPDVVCYDLQAGAPGAPVSAYLAHRRSVSKGSLPGLLLIPDAQVASADLSEAVSHAQKGALVLYFNFHGIANGQTPDFYETLAKGPLKTPFLKTPELALANLYLRVLRAVDVLCERPEWDGQTLAISGMRQGGALALAAAALDSRISFVAAAAPTLCDLGRALSLNSNPWPGLLPGLPPGLPPELYAGSLRYLDCAHLASRIRVPSGVSIGLYDAESPPAGVAAACNRFAHAPTVFLDDSASGEPSPRILETLGDTLRSHLVRKTAAGKR